MSESVKLPEGFVDSNTGGPQNWFVKETGNTLQGKLLARVTSTIDGKPKAHFRIQVTQAIPLGAKSATKIVKTVDDDKVQRLAVVGDIVALDENKALESFRALTEDGGQYEVFVTCLDKVQLDGGRSFWNFGQGVKTLKRPPARSSEETPF